MSQFIQFIVHRAELLRFRRLILQRLHSLAQLSQFVLHRAELDQQYAHVHVPLRYGRNVAEVHGVELRKDNAFFIAHLQSLQDVFNIRTFLDS